MTEENTQLPAEMPSTWTPPAYSDIQISVALIDEFGLPYDRRGVRVPIPAKEDFEQFAKGSGEMMRATVETLLKIVEGSK